MENVVGTHAYTEKGGGGGVLNKFLAPKKGGGGLILRGGLNRGFTVPSFKNLPNFYQSSKTQR